MCLDYISAQSTGAVEFTDCNKCLVYDTKKSDDEVMVLEIWGMWSTLLLPLLPSPLWPRVVALDRILSMGQIELFDI